MASVATIEKPTALVPVDNAAAAVVLFDQDKFDSFYAKLKADIEATPVDLSTKKGRDAIASRSAKVRSEKANIDRDRKRLTQEWRDNTALVNNAWKDIEARLDDLALEARKPLTEWEEAEKARVERGNTLITRFKSAANVTLDDTAATVRERGGNVWQTAIDPDALGDMFDAVQEAKQDAVDALKAALARLIREEDERAELDRLRAAEAERQAKEQAEREARETEERAAAEAKAAEERRIAAEKADQERIAAVKREAEEAARRDAEAAAEAERTRIQREHEEALAAERAKAETERAAIEEERANIARAEGERKAKEEHDRRMVEQLAAEQAQRDADQKHKTAVMKAAKEAIMTCGADEETAKKIVLLIRSGDVPNVTLRF